MARGWYVSSNKDDNTRRVGAVRNDGAEAVRESQERKRSGDRQITVNAPDGSSYRGK